MINNITTFFLLRLGIGLGTFGHGLVRLPKPKGSSKWMTSLFEKLRIPVGLVQPFSYILPFAEAITGLLLVIGLFMFTRQVLIADAVIMLLLIAGTTLIENWMHFHRS